MNSSSSAAATSGSFSGSTCWRETSSVTSDPRASNMCVNSTPVTPEPMTTMCSGSSGGGYAWRVVRTRSPSTGANSGTRGRDPVATTMKSASSSSMPPAVSTTTSCGPLSRPVPRRSRTFCDSRSCTIDSCRRCSIEETRSRSASRSTPPSACRPITWLRASSPSSPPVAIIALEGMQSHRCAAPAMTSRSTSVTSAPSVAATVAHVLPAGTPPEVYRTGGGAPDAPGWSVRVVPNLYPIVGGGNAGPGAKGAHEVVVLSPAHDKSFAQLDTAQATEVLTVLRDRVRHHLGAGHAFVQVAINQGRAAGASIEHPHAQLVALDLVPPAVAQAVERFEDSGRDLVMADLDAAGDGLRLVDGPVAAWCPRAGSTPYEVRVAARVAGSRFDDTGDPDVQLFAGTTRSVLARLAAAGGDAPYNLVVHTAPAGASARSFHWYVEVQTRITVPAGFEQGTGILVNTVPPEVAARDLREGVDHG